MAHGGSDDWNRTVADAVEPLAAEIPTVVAYGMADPETLAAGLDSLSALGVERVTVVRLFISGQSFLAQTDYFLGLSSTPPERFVLFGRDEDAPPPDPIDHELAIATHEDGLMVSDEAARITLSRALAASQDESTESVLLIAHGMGNEDQNQRVLESLETMAEAIRAAGFAAVEVTTLREDWADKRAVAEDQIRRFVGEEVEVGRRVIVIPVRLYGFGPYAEVLAGLEYTPSEGLLPHEEVTVWIRGTALRVACDAGWYSAIDRCGPEDLPTAASTPLSRRDR